MLEIDLLDALREDKRERMAGWARKILPELGYRILDEEPRRLRMVKESPYYHMEAVVVVGNDEKLGGAYFASCIRGKDREFLTHPAWYDDKKTTTTVWFEENPGRSDVGRVVFAMMESYLSGATNITEILGVCGENKRKNAPKQPWRMKKEERKALAEIRELFNQNIAKKQAEEAAKQKAAEPEYEIVVKYIAPEPPQSIGEMKLFYLLGKSAGLDEERLEAMCGNPRILEYEMESYGKWTEMIERVIEKRFSGETGGVRIDYDSIDFGWHRSATRELLLDFDVGRKRFEDLQDIIIHEVNPEYKNTCKKVRKEFKPQNNNPQGQSCPGSQCS